MNPVMTLFTQLMVGRIVTLITTNKASFSKNSAHLNNYGPPHHRGVHRHSRRGDRTYRGSHPGSASHSGHWQQHARPNFTFPSRPNRNSSDPPSFPSYSSLLGISGPDSLGPNLLLPFPLHFGLPLLKAMHLLLVFLVRDRHKVITPGLVLL